MALQTASLSLLLLELESEMQIALLPLRIAWRYELSDQLVHVRQTP